MKNSVLIHYFLMNLRFFIFSMEVLCVLKMYHVRLFIVEKMGFGTAHRRCEIHFKPQSLLQKTCLSYTFETLAAYVGMFLHRHALATHASHSPCMQAKGHFGHFISKIDFCLFKRLYFPF